MLAADAKAYVGGLTAFREERPADWILMFARAIGRAAAKASELALRLTEARRNRAWEARDVFDLIDAVERDLVTPSDDEELSGSRRRPRKSSRRQ